MNKYEHLCKALENELELLNNKYATKQGMDKADVELAKMLFSALDHKQNYLTGKEMLEQREQEGKNWNDSSYARGRNHYNGQYMSRDIGDRMSGHYPTHMIAYYPQHEYQDY